MTSKIVNVTAYIVARSIAEALADAPRYPYQTIFAIPHYQHLLIAHVLSGVRNHYVVFTEDTPHDYMDTLIYFLKEQEKIESLIQAGIVSIVQDDVNWTENVQIPDTVPVFYGTQNR